MYLLSSLRIPQKHPLHFYFEIPLRLSLTRVPVPSVIMSHKITSKRMKGFMCQSKAATAVCRPVGNPGRSVIVPRRLDRTLLLDNTNTRLLKNANYTRLVHSHRPSAPSNNHSPAAINVSSIKKSEDDQKPKPIQIKPPSKSSSDQVFQVVVMRVSLHCQGCAGKVKKHLSKMEGVTSFSIDLETKRVTVMGHVSPAGVLESISKVKRAEFWPC